MEKTGRNIPCPCGSGRKFKACCIRPLTRANPNDHPLLKEAFECFRFGFFNGAVERCKKLEGLSRQLEVACAGVAWLSRIYSGRRQNNEDAKRSPYILQLLQGNGGGGSFAA